MAFDGGVVFARRLLPALVVVVIIALVEPMLLTGIIRSPRALAAIAAIAVATWFVSGIAGRRWGRLGSTTTKVVALALVGWFLVAPTLRQKTLDEALPSAADVVPQTLDAPASETATVEPPAAESPVEEATPPPAPAPGPAAPAAPAPTPAPAPARAPTPAPASQDPAPAPSAPQRLTTGRLEGIGHDATGDVSVFRLADGSAVVRFEDVDIKNAPDPVLYLVPGRDRQSREGGVEVGPLKATRGSFNHPVPESFDLEAPFTVFIWCERFSTAIANANQRA